MEKYRYRKCELCDNMIELTLVTNKYRKNYGKIVKSQENRRFCSLKCQNKWQRQIKWEDRVGKEVADRIREETSVRVKGDKNPTKNENVAKKVSNSLKKYLIDNPRCGEKNPFYGKEHTEEYKQWARKSRESKWSYDIDGYNKLLENTPKGENHPNWKGGISNEPYPFEFNKNLKEKIKKRDNYKCCICNKQTQKLAIHHIDYNKTNILETNLISLCYNCHSITNYNRQDWELMLNNKIKNMTV